MTNLLRTGVAWLSGVLNTHAAETVTYRRGAVDTSVTATYGRTNVELADETGMIVQVAEWDFLILATELASDPLPGDLIIADGRKHLVAPLADSPCWRWSDPYRTNYRIHTKDCGDS